MITVKITMKLPPSIIMLVQTPLSLSSCSLASTQMARSAKVGRSASIGVPRRAPILLAPAICTSVVATSVQPVATIGATGLASGASSPVGSRLVPSFFPSHLSREHSEEGISGANNINSKISVRKSVQQGAGARKSNTNTSFPPLYF